MKDERRASASVPLSLFLFLFHFPFPLSISNYRYHTTTTTTPACTSLAACTSLTYIRQVYLPANFSFTRPPNGTRVLKIHAAHTFSRGVRATWHPRCSLRDSSCQPGLRPCSAKLLLTFLCAASNPAATKTGALQFLCAKQAPCSIAHAGSSPTLLSARQCFASIRA